MMYHGGKYHKSTAVQEDHKPLIAKLNTNQINWDNVNNELDNMDWEEIFDKCQYVYSMKEAIIDELTNILIRNGATEKKGNQEKNQNASQEKKTLQKDTERYRKS